MKDEEYLPQTRPILVAKQISIGWHFWWSSPWAEAPRISAVLGCHGLEGGHSGVLVHAGVSSQTISGAERPSRAPNKVFALRPGSVTPSPLTTGWAELENVASAPCSGLALGPGLFLPESTPSLAPPLHVQRIPMGKVTTQESLHACPQSFLLTLLDTGVC